NGTLTISPSGVITITAIGQSIVYGSNIPTLTNTFYCSNNCSSGVMTGSLTTSKGTAGTATFHNAGIDVGNYGISQGTLADTIGDPIDFIGASLAVTPKIMTVSGVTASNKTYDGITTATVNTANAVVVGIIAADKKIINLNGVGSTTGAFASANA